MAKIQWKKEDVIRKFKEAVTPPLSKPGVEGLADKFRDITAKRKAGAGPGVAVPPVTS